MPLGINPSPVPLRLKNAGSGTPSPQGRGLLIQFYPRCPAEDVGRRQRATLSTGERVIGSVLPPVSSEECGTRSAPAERVAPLPLGGEGGPPPAFFSRGGTGEGVLSLRSVSDTGDRVLWLSARRMTCPVESFTGSRPQTLESRSALPLFGTPSWGRETPARGSP